MYCFRIIYILFIQIFLVVNSLYALALSQEQKGIFLSSETSSDEASLSSSPITVSSSEESEETERMKQAKTIDVSKLIELLKIKGETVDIRRINNGWLGLIKIKIYIENEEGGLVVFLRSVYVESAVKSITEAVKILKAQVIKKEKTSEEKIASAERLLRNETHATATPDFIERLRKRKQDSPVSFGERLPMSLVSKSLNLFAEVRDEFKSKHQIGDNLSNYKKIFYIQYNKESKEFGVHDGLKHDSVDEKITNLVEDLNLLIKSGKFPFICEFNKEYFVAITKEKGIKSLAEVSLNFKQQNRFYLHGALFQHGGRNAILFSVLFAMGSILSEISNIEDVDNLVEVYSSVFNMFFEQKGSIINLKEFKKEIQDLEKKVLKISGFSEFIESIKDLSTDKAKLKQSITQFLALQKSS
jgi:hypothetical protein